MKTEQNIGNALLVKGGYLEVASTRTNELGTELNRNAVIAISELPFGHGIKIIQID